MDKDFEKKVKRKRIRAIAVTLVLVVIAVYLVLDMNVEKADYADSLQDEITTAHELVDDAVKNAGNEKGQYASYTLLAFQKQIVNAEEVAGNAESEYNDKKDAYELLKEQNKEFKKAKNKDVLSKDDAKKLAKDGGTKEFKVELKDGAEAVLSVEGKNIEKPVTMNFMAREQGPYFEEITDMLSKLKLSGQVISFYQEKTFGAKVKAVVPFYTEKKAKGYAYKIDLKNNKLEFVSDAKIDKDAQTAEFTVKDGGDYIVVTKKMHKDAAKKSVDIKKAEKEVKAKENGESGSTGTSSGSSGNPAVKPESKEIEVSLEIRCDTLAADPSKLTDPTLEAYVPADGTILPKTTVKVKEGSTVFDVLNRVCRNKNIHVSSVYTPAFGSYYIEGIGYLYEFDGGSLSGWEYKVNGWFPNYGCSEYTLKDGDTIVWAYTCDLGKDIGGSNAAGA